MRKFFIGIHVLFLFSILSYSQEVKVTVELSSDTILIGNYLRVKFTLENASANFEAPAFEGFRVVTGPNMSSSMNFINGKLTQKLTYEYFLDPIDIGKYYIEEAYFVADDETYGTEPLEIWIEPNPLGIKQDSDIKFLDEYIFGEEKQENPEIKIKAKRHKI